MTSWRWHHLWLLCCSMALLATQLPAQSVNTKKKELDQLRASIKATQQQIDKLTRQEAARRSKLSTYERQRHQLSSFIRALEDTLARLRDSASTVRTQIQQTQGALADAERSYNATSQSMLRYVARRKGVPQSQVASEAVFRSLTRALEEYRSRMSRLRDSLAVQEQTLQLYASTQQSVLSTKSRQERMLGSTIARNAEELKRIRSSKTELAQQLKAKQQSVAKLRSMIERLVADEQRTRQQRRAESPKDRPTATPRQERPSRNGGVASGGFNRNSLPWPTPATNLVNGYGSYKNPATGITFDNPGIDIKASTGTRVTAVASGTVSSVKWLPGFNSLVIIDHGNGMRTVYANLATVAVSAGSRVQQGTALGTSGENIDGELLHFEVWNGRERQNPLTYLR